MPEGIVPELLIVAGLVALIVAATLLSRRGRAPRRDAGARKEIAAEGERTSATAVAEPETETAGAPPAAEVVVEEAPEVERVRPSLRERLAKSRNFLGTRLAEAFGGGIDAETWDDIEAVLIQADVGVDAATKIVEEVKSAARQARLTDPGDVKAMLADQLVEMFDPQRERALCFSSDGITVWLVVGVNGTGKTTTIGKLAADLRMHGRNVALAAADTFRAAADEQLGIWAQRASADLIRHQHGADPGAVAYDALQHARAKSLDVLIVDTAGRLHTKIPLMDELAKVRRVIEKEALVQESLLIIDATAGQNGLVQARQFAEATGVSGVVLTKLDGTAKGGIAIAIEDTLGIPIKLIGVGEGLEDLEPFDPKSYVDALLS
jgi:fused signal recognition particle receptor